MKVKNINLRKVVVATTFLIALLAMATGTKRNDSERNATMNPDIYTAPAAGNAGACKPDAEAGTSDNEQPLFEGSGLFFFITYFVSVPSGRD